MWSLHSLRMKLSARVLKCLMWVLSWSHDSHLLWRFHDSHLLLACRDHECFCDSVDFCCRSTGVLFLSTHFIRTRRGPAVPLPFAECFTHLREDVLIRCAFAFSLGPIVQFRFLAFLSWDCSFRDKSGLPLYCLPQERKEKGK